MEYRIVNKRRTDTKVWEAKALAEGIPPVLQWARVENYETIERALVRYIDGLGTAQTMSFKAVGK